MATILTLKDLDDLVRHMRIHKSKPPAPERKVIPQATNSKASNWNLEQTRNFRVKGSFDEQRERTRQREESLTGECKEVKQGS